MGFLYSGGLICRIQGIPEEGFQFSVSGMCSQEDTRSEAEGATAHPPTPRALLASQHPGGSLPGCRYFGWPSIKAKPGGLRASAKPIRSLSLVELLRRKCMYSSFSKWPRKVNGLNLGSKSYCTFSCNRCMVDMNMYLIACRIWPLVLGSN